MALARPCLKEACSSTQSVASGRRGVVMIPGKASSNANRLQGPDLTDAFGSKQKQPGKVGVRVQVGHEMNGMLCPAISAHVAERCNELENWLSVTLLA
eukprot:scaffold98525_cov15-Tisochrysis_lutea.AAC.1